MTDNLPKCTQAKTIKSFNDRWFSTIVKKKEPEKHQRIKRWHLYHDGMSLFSILETEGLCYQDIGFYIKADLMELIPATPEYIAENKEIFCEQRKIKIQNKRKEDAVPTQEASCPIKN